MADGLDERKREGKAALVFEMEIGELAPAARAWRVSRLAAALADLVSCLRGSARPVDD
jgi:hypothetical protein